MTSFYFILWFEVNTTLTLLTGTLITVSVLAMLYARFLNWSQDQGEPAN